jgi:hypothetical protein
MLYPDTLDVDELADAELREFPPVTRAFHPAEGEPGVGLDDAIDEDRAGFDPGGQGLGGRRIAGDDRCAQAEGRAVGQRDGVLAVLRPADGGQRAEGPGSRGSTLPLPG